MSEPLFATVIKNGFLLNIHTEMLLVQINSIRSKLRILPLRGKYIIKIDPILININPHRYFPPKLYQPISLITLADWSQLHQKFNIYQSINNTLEHLLKQENINGLLINGDIAYDLDSNEGKNFEETLALINRVGKYVPVFINTGNHEHNSQDVIDIFDFAFQQYGKDKTLATGLNLGPLYLVGFGPYDVLYVKGKQRSIKPSTQFIKQSQSFTGLKQSMEKALLMNKTIIPTSHYPHVCSATEPKCHKDLTLLGIYFELMLQSKVFLYIGAHVHTYERQYPFCLKNSSFIIKESPYHISRNRSSDDYCMVTIIQGIAGNDIDIVENYNSVKQFTAAVQYGKTGVGLLKVSVSQVSYKHYRAAPNNDGPILRDQLQFIIQQNEELTDS